VRRKKKEKRRKKSEEGFRNEDLGLPVEILTVHIKLGEGG